MKRDESFGVVPLSKTSGQWEVFLIQHNRSGYWGFPKGHAEPHETAEAAAFRELKEETNLEPLRLIVTGKHFVTGKLRDWKLRDWETS